MLTSSLISSQWRRILYMQNENGFEITLGNKNHSLAFFCMKNYIVYETMPSYIAGMLKGLFIIVS